MNDHCGLQFSDDRLAGKVTVLKGRRKRCVDLHAAFEKNL
jgi:hypothetical protein